ncbi:MAG TPA: hypothetical protein VK195_14335 [Burkholderiaceae bacterium]|nr:hypothetical protein [Burkholderiaceae bacterium]
MAASPSFEQHRHGQRGVALFDALMSIVLLGFIGTGLLYATSRAAQAQRSANVMNLTVGELRFRLQTDGVAKGCSVAGGAGGAEGAERTESAKGAAEHDGGSMTLEIAPGVRPSSVERACTVQASEVTVNGVTHSAKVPHVEIQVTDSTLLGSSNALVLRN